MRPHPFRPLTDPEYAFLTRHFPTDAPRRRGRPPTDLRRTLDAIFWIACSTAPWRDLPEQYGRPDTASRQLRRWARSGQMDHLLALVAARTPEDEILNALAWRICRAWRRISRIVGLKSLVRAKNAGLRAALPAEPRWLPDPILSEIAHSLVAKSLKSTLTQPPGTFSALAGLMRAAGGNRRRWRLK